MLKKKAVRILLAITLIAIILCMLSLALFDNSENIISRARKKFFYATVASGTSGTCSWTLDSNGVLTIRPTNGTSGTMGVFPGTNASFYQYSSQIKTIQFTAIVYAPANSANLFYHLENMTTFNGVGFYPSPATTMESFFSECTNLSSINFGGNFVTSNVTNMKFMFNNC